MVVKRVAWRGIDRREAPSVIAQLTLPRSTQGSHKELKKVTSSTWSNLWLWRNHPPTAEHRGVTAVGLIASTLKWPRHQVCVCEVNSLLLLSDTQPAGIATELAEETCQICGSGQSRVLSNLRQGRMLRLRFGNG